MMDALALEKQIEADGRAKDNKVAGDTARYDDKGDGLLRMIERKKVNHASSQARDQGNKLRETLRDTLEFCIFCQLDHHY
jgi:hypothetical protein